MSTETQVSFDVFLSHSHQDSSMVEALGERLADEAHLNVWLDKWILVPGNNWQQEMARGLDQARTCAVCISRETPTGWFREEIQRALNRQTKDQSFRVIPVILPGGDEKIVNDFLELRTWVPFKERIDEKYGIHLLVSGILGRPPGRFPREVNAQADAPKSDLAEIRASLAKIKILREEKLIDDVVAIDYQRRILEEFIRKPGE